MDSSLDSHEFNKKLRGKKEYATYPFQIHFVGILAAVILVFK